MLGPPQPYAALTSFTPRGRPKFLSCSQRHSLIAELQDRVSELEHQIADLQHELQWAEQHLEAERMRNSELVCVAEQTVACLRGEISVLTERLSLSSSLSKKNTEFYRISSSNDLSTLAGDSSVPPSPSRSGLADDAFLVLRPPRSMMRPSSAASSARKDWTSRVGCAFW